MSSMGKMNVSISECENLEDNRYSIRGSLEAFALTQSPNPIPRSGARSSTTMILVPPVNLTGVSDCALSELGRVR